jgi:hypothetical protein
MKSMKSIMSAGLCLVAMLVVGMVAAGTASAVPKWEHCETEKETGARTKYETDQCKTEVSTGGQFSWQEVTGTEKVVSHASLLLEDEIPLVGVVSISCTGKDEGSVGPGRFDRITAITEIHCVTDERCEKITIEAEPRNLPWQTELFETEGKIRDALKSGGAGEPGWAVTCEVLGIEKTDVCTSEAGTTSVENVWTKGIGETHGELLVLADFPKPNAPKAKCTVTGANTGDVLGTVATLQANGQALRVSK